MKWLLLAVGGYILYEYLYPTSTAPVTTTVIPPLNITTVGGGATGGPIAPVAAQPQVSATLQTQLLQLANGAALNADEWAYYYTQATGASVSAAQMQSILVALFGTGYTNTTRATTIPVTAFLTAMQQVGMSGLGIIGYPHYGFGRLHLIN